MAETTIITGQFVRISQTPASIGERLIALVIDFILIGFYVYATATLLSTLRISSDFIMILIMIVVYLPVLGYSFLCEMFNHGRSFGKNLMNIRVVKADGSTPGISSYLLRWLLFPIDSLLTGGFRTIGGTINEEQSADGGSCSRDHGYQRTELSQDPCQP